MTLNSLMVLSSHVLAACATARLRFDRKVTAAVWGGYALLCAAFWVVGAELFPLKVFIIFAFYGSYLLHHLLYFLLTEGRRGERLFILLTYDVLFTYCAGCFDYFKFTLFPGAPWRQLAANSALLGLAMALFFQKLLPLFKEAARFVEKGWGALCVLTLSLFALVVSLNIWPRTMISPEFPDLWLYAVVGLLLLTLYPALFSALRNMARLAQARQTELQLKLFCAQVEAQREQIEEARRARHDLRHHDMAVAAYARHGDIPGLLRYLDQHEDQALSREPLWCENGVLNTLISLFSKKAEAKGIAVNVRAQAGRDLPLPDPDLVAVAANVLENAVQGCEASGAEHPFISLEVHPKAGKLVFLCRNSCAAGLDCEKGFPEPDYGVGLRSVAAAVARNGGHCCFSASGGVFSSGILLNLDSDKRRRK